MISSKLCPLPGLVGTGFYGLGQDDPYCRHQMMGCVVKGNRLNQAGSLRFQFLRGGDSVNNAIRPCLPPGPAVFGGDFDFFFVF